MGGFTNLLVCLVLLCLAFFVLVVALRLAFRLGSWVLAYFLGARYDVGASKAAEELNEEDESDLQEDGIDDVKNPSDQPTRFVIVLVREARAKFGLMSASEANRIVVGDWMRRRCSEAKVRNTHIVRLVPSAIVWFFVPTSDDILAERIRGASLVRERINEYHSAPGHIQCWLARLLWPQGPEHEPLRFSKK
jgi:hypothetical protein